MTVIEEKNNNENYPALRWPETAISKQLSKKKTTEIEMNDESEVLLGSQNREKSALDTSKWMSCCIYSQLRARMGKAKK